MTGNRSRLDRTPPGDRRPADSPLVLRSPPPPEDEAAESLAALEGAADPLFATQAAQLVEYLKSRQSELARRQQTLDEQALALEQARQELDCRGAGAASGRSDGSSDEPDRDSPRVIRGEFGGSTAAARSSTPLDSPVAPSISLGAAPHGPARVESSNRRTAGAPLSASTDDSALERRLDDLQQRELDLVRREETARQLLQDVRRLHQESLETRIVTEQLWVQLAGRLPHDELTRSLAQLRRQLDEHYREARAEVAEQQRQARETAAKLEQQQQHLRRQRRDLQAWVDNRHAEFELEAARLLAAQQELERRQRQLDQFRLQADEEIQQHQRQIRQLTAQLRCREELGRVA